MNPVRRFLIRSGLRPVTPDDLTALLDRAQDKSLPTRARFRAMTEYIALTQSDEQIAAVIDHLNQIIGG